jgi:hypothetical protein
MGRRNPMNDLLKLAPLAFGLIVFGFALAFLLQRGMSVGTWLLAAFLLGHGLVHIMFAVPAPAAPAPAGGMEYPFDVTRSWLVANHGADASLVRLVVIGLVAVTVVGYALTGLATVGILVPQAAWPPLLVASTAASLLLMVIGLSPALALGIAIDLALIGLVVTSFWSPASVPG